MKVKVLSKQRFDYVMGFNCIEDSNVEENQVDTFFISINDSQGTTEVPHFKEDHENVIRLFFDDVEEDLQIPIVGTDKFTTAKAFTLEQAQQIIDFVEKNKDKKYCIVHCAAGISRSGAVGMFINDFYGEEKYNVFMQSNPHIHPNPTVTRLLKQVRPLINL